MRTIYDVAKAMGDEGLAADALMQIKQLEIKIAGLTAEAKRAEAVAALEVVKAKRAELEASNQLTPAKIAELNAQEAAAKVKAIEADIAEITADRLFQLANVTDTSGAAAANAASNYDKLNTALGGVKSSADDAIRRMGLGFSTGEM